MHTLLPRNASLLPALLGLWVVLSAGIASAALQTGWEESYAVTDQVSSGEQVPEKVQQRNGCENEFSLLSTGHDYRVGAAIFGWCGTLSGPKETGVMSLRDGLRPLRFSHAIEVIPITVPVT